MLNYYDLLSDVLDKKNSFIHPKNVILEIGVIVLSQTPERNLKLYVIVKHIVKKN